MEISNKNTKQRRAFSIYNASAGSGKTYTLVKEYLKIILTAKRLDAYRNILAITFTNKTVNEMKSRIVGNLTEFTKDVPSDKAMELLEDLSMDDAVKMSIPAIKQKSKEIIKHIIHNYAAFDISTIDKFTHRIIRTFANDLGLPPNFEPTIDLDNLMIEAVESLISKAGEDAALTKLLIDYTMEKTDDNKNWDITSEVLETGKLILNENDREEIAKFKDKKIEDFQTIKKQLFEKNAILLNKSSQLTQEILDLIELNGIKSGSFNAFFTKHLCSIVEKRYNNTKKYHNFEDIKINGKSKDRAVIENIVPEMLAKLAVIYASLDKRDFYQAVLTNITPLSLLNQFETELATIQKQQNVLPVVEFNAIIHREIQNQPAPFIYERLGEKYRHFFIDEFQDTSEMQWENLIPLIDNATSSCEINGENGTLLIVGDPKQSIYRWRGGKVEQFINLCGEKIDDNANPFNNKDRFYKVLETNYRSFSEIINFNNDFFKVISNEFKDENYRKLYLENSFQKTNNNQGGYVNISFLGDSESYDDEVDEDNEYGKTDLYVRATYDTILKVKALNFNYSDIVVLTRSNINGVAVAKYLTEKNITVISAESLLIQNAAEIRFLIACLKYINNTFDDQSKSKMLLYLATNNQEKCSIHDFVNLGMQQSKELDFENYLQNININISFQKLRKKSLYETIELLISTFLNPEISLRNMTNSSSYLQYFLDIVLERDLRKQGGINDFLDYWHKNNHKFSVPSPEGVDAVKILTIHKSKGLEFPVVILPFAEQDYSKNKNKLWLDADEQEIGVSKALINNTNAVANFNEQANQAFFQSNQETLLDNVNVLYVAMTRAEEQLYIISDHKKLNKQGGYPNNMASFFIKYLETLNSYEPEKNQYEFGTLKQKTKIKPFENKSKNIPLVTKKLNFNNIRIAQKETLMWRTNRQDSIEFGNTLHEILSKIITINDISTAIATAKNDGLITENQIETIEKTITNIVTHPTLIPFFDGSMTVLNEQIIIQKKSNLIKPDRIIINYATNEASILDYKTGIQSESHKKQLLAYQTAIEKMNFRVVQKTLIYIGKEIEIIII